MDRRNPFANPNDFGSWLLGAVVAVGAVAGLLWALALAGVHEPRAERSEVSAAPDAPAAGQVSLGPAEIQPAEAQPDAVAVHACVRDGQRVYSDQPCGPAGKRHVIDVGAINTYTPSAVDTRPVAVMPSPPAAAASAAGEPTELNDGLCRAIEQEIEAIDARMRAGYRSQEGEYWRGRWHDAKERYHRAGCTWRR